MAYIRYKEKDYPIVFDMKAAIVFQELTGIDLTSETVSNETLMKNGKQFVFALCCDSELEKEGWRPFINSMKLKEYMEYFRLCWEEMQKEVQEMLDSTPNHESEKK